MGKPFTIGEMKEGRTELEFDEFEKLLGEIPIATSGKPHSDDTGPKMASFEGSLSPISVNSCQGPINEKLQNFGSLGDRKISSNVTKQLPIIRIQPEEMNLPDDQSLTSAFAGLSFTDGVTAAPLAKSKSLENCSILLDGQHLKDLKKPNSNVDPNLRAILSLQYPKNVPCGFDKVGETRAGQESSNMLKFNAEELKKRQVGYRQQFENFSATAPLAHAVQGLQFLSHVPVHHGVQFPAMPDQQQFFLDAQSLQPYFHPQQINERQISWRSMEEEQFCRIHHQYLYLQHLPIQRLEAQHPIQDQGNITTRLTSENLREPFVEVPISCQLENSRQESFWNNSADYRTLNLPNPAMSFPNFSAMPVLEKVAKQKFPEKILTKSHGTNTQENVKFGTVSKNESLTRVSRNEEALSNHHHWHDFSIPRTRGFQLDSLSLWGLSTEDANLKSTHLKPVPQKCYSVDDATGRIYLMAKDQHGCRFLQRKLAEGTRADVEKIFFEIIDYVVELMTDPFGNYLVQKLLENCDDDQRMQILHTITRRSGELVRISCNMHGTRAVQKVIETLKTPAQFSMVVSSLKPGIVTLIKNINGNHVAQRCLQCLMPECTEFLFEAATANCVDLATDRHGCCVLQKCLSHSDGEQRRRLVCEITSNALILSQDPYGNYVVQYVFDLQLPWATVDILNQLEGNYADLSVQKFSSNVVEKCLHYAGEDYQPRVIQELIDNPRLDQIMLDPYGNYVIQAALSQSKGALHNALVAAIRRHDPVLQTSPYGKKVLSSSGLKK
ncbi:pumilio homolog 12 isoform X2 [Carya illinoinensis]|nr:pumilio homolog 12 isoform X2 [Carya illinoinensis]KAG6632716.1 hypothetical protein CIPAW_13G177800 [Carya illinoinensis]KAG6632720.1 hypothetical protein CIPAW_13G177800 [Carya illinoinensis]KAG6683145.1 hypothetical protein I3842_13G177300 [Carya illinoinensis]